MSMSRARSEAPRLATEPPPEASAARPDSRGLRRAPAPPVLSVVVPVHNEQDNILPLLDEITAALDGVGEFEIVVVDDGSTDGTPNVLRASGRKGLVVVRHRRNCGQSAALLSGVRIARGAWIATLDGDGQNDPADIPKLWRMLGETGDPDLKMIAGHRKRRQDTWLKRLSSRIANGVRGWLLGDSTPDTGCGLKLFERELFLRVPHFDHFHRFLPALIQHGGGRVTSVEVRHRHRRSGRSHYGVGNRLWVGIVDLVGVMWLKRRSARRAELLEVTSVDDGVRDSGDGV